MSKFSKTPTYNLKVVVKETGIKPDTLRAWERRYGLPDPQRTPGGHRLYSPYDIEMIKWLTIKQDEGLSISRAIELWQSLQQDGADPIEQETAVAPVNSLPPNTMAYLANHALQDLRQQWVNACLQFDETTAEKMLIQAFGLYPVEMVCLEILQKGLAEVGELWYANKASVQQEHFASALTMRRISALITAAPPPSRNGRILVACPPKEEHTFASLLITLFFRQRGWDVVYLGANVPLDRFEGMVGTVKPNLVILTAQQLSTAANLLDVVEYLGSLGIPSAYGGRIFNQIPEMRTRIPAHFMGVNLDEVVPNTIQVLSQHLPTPKAKPVPESYQRAATVYRHKQAALEASVWHILQDKNMPYEHIVSADLHLSQDILAALRLGNMSYLGSQISWVHNLIQNYHYPLHLLSMYLMAYLEAARQHIADGGEPIIAWLEGITTQ